MSSHLGDMQAGERIQAVLFPHDIDKIKRIATVREASVVATTEQDSLLCVLLEKNV